MADRQVRTTPATAGLKARTTSGSGIFGPRARGGNT